MLGNGSSKVCGMRILQVCSAISTKNQPSHCKLSAFPDKVLTESFICSLIMRKEGLGKEENGCLKYKCSPQAADRNWPQTVSPGSNPVCPK